MDRPKKYAARIQNLRDAMQDHGVDAVFLAPSGDMEYVTGLRRRPPDPVETSFQGDDLLGILVTRDRVITFLPASSAIHGVEGLLLNCPWLTEDIFRLPRGVDQAAEGYAVFGNLGLANATVAFPRFAQAMTVINLSHHYPHMRFVNTDAFMNPLRAMRDPDDLELIQEACRITDAVFREVVSWMRRGVEVKDVIREIDAQMIDSFELASESRTTTSSPCLPCKWLAARRLHPLTTTQRAAPTSASSSGQSSSQRARDTTVAGCSCCSTIDARSSSDPRSSRGLRGFGAR